MKKAKQIELIQAIHQTIEKQKKKEDVSGATWQIPATRYTSKEQLADEKKIVFKNFPIVVGPAASLAKAGDYFLHDYTGVPIMVVKGKDEKIRAFLNICRHRGVRLLEEKEGHIQRNIVCPYHAWSYDTAGCLKTVFHPEAFKEVSPASHSLIELDCAVRIGLIFVVPNPNLKGQYNIDTYLREVTDMVEHFGVADYVSFEEKTITNPFNWKLGIEAGTEAYHFKIAHAKTIGPYVFDRLGEVVKENKLHCTTIYPKKAILKLKDQPIENWDLRKYGNMLIHIFPNTTFLIMEDHVMAVSLYPTDEKSCITKSFLLVPKMPTTKEETEHFQLNSKIYWETVVEDAEMTRLQQESFNGFDKLSITVGSYETLILQFENLIQQAINGQLKLSDFK